MFRFILVLIMSISLCAEKQAAEEKVPKIDWRASKVIVKTYPVRNTSASTIKQIIKPYLSAKGSIVYLKNRNSVVIVDIPAVHKQIGPLFKAVVRDPVRIQVDVVFRGESSLKRRGINIGVNGRSGVKIKVENGKVKKPHIHIDLEDSQENSTSYQKIMLTTMSGKPARLWSIKTESELRWIEQYRYRRYDAYGNYIGKRGFRAKFDSREVGVSMWMRPVYSDDGLVTIEVYPVVTGRVKGKRRSYRVQKVDTTVTVRNHHKVYLGGHHQHLNKFLSSLFSAYGKKATTDSLDIYLTPHAKAISPRRK